MPRLQLDIVTPDKVLLSREVDYVGAVGVEGEFGVLPQHAPLLAALAVAPLHYRIGDVAGQVCVCGGFVEVLDDTVTVVAEAAELSEHIDAARAEQSRARAEKRLGEREETVDVARAEASLKRALLRLRIAGAKGC
jgi:F-type H+-transporting ATPase subunit epsilon